MVKFHQVSNFVPLVIHQGSSPVYSTLWVLNFIVPLACIFDEDIKPNCNFWWFVCFFLSYWDQRYSRTDIRGFASPVKKSKIKGRKIKENTTLPEKLLLDDYKIEDDAQGDNGTRSSDVVEVENSQTVPSRSSVLQACTITSGLICLLGFLIRQVQFTLKILSIIGYTVIISEHMPVTCTLFLCCIFKHVNVCVLMYNIFLSYHIRNWWCNLL